MLFLLGAPVTGVNVELGYAPHHRGGGVQGNRRSRSYKLADLRTWTSTEAVLKGQPTA